MGKYNTKDHQVTLEVDQKKNTFAIDQFYWCLDIS